MKKMIKALKGYSNICFLDFEGTQFTSEMIALGAYFVTINPKTSLIKKAKEPILIYVKAKNKIGAFVEDLTGINQDTLNKEGVSFAVAMKKLKEYCGVRFNKTVFMTFGNHDMRILNQSVSYNMDAPKEIVQGIHHRYLDFQSIISEFIKDKSNNPLSLSNYCELFKIGFDGEQHNAQADAYNLARLYEAFLKNKEIVLEQYMLTLQNIRHLPSPIYAMTKKLASGEDVSSIEFLNLCREYLS